MWPSLWSLILIPPQLVVTNAFIIKLTGMSEATSIINQYDVRNQPKKPSQGFLQLLQFRLLPPFPVCSPSLHPVDAPHPPQTYKLTSPRRRALGSLGWHRPQNQEIRLVRESSFQRHAALRVVCYVGDKHSLSFHFRCFLLRLLGAVKLTLKLLTFHRQYTQKGDVRISILGTFPKLCCCFLLYFLN